MEKMSFEIYRYNPDVDAKPYMQRYELELEPTDVKLLDALVRLKAARRPPVFPPFLPRRYLRFGRYEHQRQKRLGMLN